MDEADLIDRGEIGFPRGNSADEFVGNMLRFLEDGAAKAAQESPSLWSSLSPDAIRDVAAIQEAVVLKREIEGGNSIAAGCAELLRADIWDRWRAGTGLQPKSDALAEVLDKLAAVATGQLALMDRICADLPPQNDMAAKSGRVHPQSTRQASVAEAPTIETSTAPLFSELENEYFELRKSGGASASAISTGRMRAATFKAIVGDRPIDCYLPIDLQRYVNSLQYLPVELSREGKNSKHLREMGIIAAIEKNEADRCYEPIALKTLREGYVQIVKAIINAACGLRSIRNPFDGFRVRWPDNAKPSVAREALDYEKLDRVFKVGVDSGYLDDAMLGPLCLLSSRRIGILPFIRGSDFDRKHGADIVRVNGIVFDKDAGRYMRVGYKTDQSLRFFVLHDFFRQIGFVDWAIAQGDNFIFRLLASTSDPGDAASKRLNRLLKKGGAIGMNIEVAHSLRHGARDMFIEEEISGDAARIQMGHELNDVHTAYGKQNALRRAQCQELARFELPTEIDWSMFHGLDFDVLARAPRQIGRPKSVKR